ncbi:DUF4340 domain-containing protein [uncultured Cytophaga sp.]|uniref:DUF4340 domain-containing protein n=1 Tax=uncultured Cytophaga sp. TaxID=160238 RepID=UPI0026388364|nr:DUF4340 domain-containing protein [uncultured Cytophaga sp.]
MLKGITTRVKILFVIAIVTGFWALYTSISKDHFGKPVYNDFIAIDTSDITKVSFTVKGETHYVAPKTSTTWFIDSKYEVRRDIVTTMKLGLARMEVKMPVSTELRDKIKKQLLREGVEVEVKTEENTVSFWIITNENDKNSSYYLSSKDAEPYIIYVPGFTGDLSDLFKLKAGDWRNKALYRNSIGSIQEIELNYASAPDDGFKIEKNLGNYHVVNMKSADSTKLYTYLSAFQRINVENYLVDKERDSVDYLLKSQNPEVTLTLIDIDKTQSKTIQIYKALPGTKSLYAKIVDNGELVTLNPELIYKLLVRKQWFMDK